MTLEAQVTSLELSKRLKDLGVRQESLFFWQEWPNIGNKLVRFGDPIYDLVVHPEGETWCSAFTVAELLLLINQKNSALIITLQSTGGRWFIPPVASFPHFSGETAADALASMIIHVWSL